MERVATGVEALHTQLITDCQSFRNFESASELLSILFLFLLWPVCVSTAVAAASAAVETIDEQNLPRSIRQEGQFRGSCPSLPGTVPTETYDPRTTRKPREIEMKRQRFIEFHTWTQN